MACYHFHAGVISRGQGHSVAASSAYICGEKLRDIYEGKIHDRSYRQDVLHKEILLPSEAPREFLDRQTWLDALNISERRQDAQMARDFKLALPRELSFEEQQVLVKGFLCENFIRYGFCADMAIHDGIYTPHNNAGMELVDTRQANPHAHVIIPFRTVGEGGFHRTKIQSRAMNNPATLTRWRQEWARVQNREFERLGFDIRVSHESLAAQGIDREPTFHMGAAAMAMERQGVRTARGDRYREIVQRNQHREHERQQRKERLHERTREPDRSR